MTRQLILHRLSALVWRNAPAGEIASFLRAAAFALDREYPLIRAQPEQEVAAHEST